MLNDFALIRYATQWNAEKTKDKVISMVHGLCDKMRATEGFGDGQSKHFSEGDCAELLDATHSMFESRRVNKFTYVREFLLEKKVFRLEEQLADEIKKSGEDNPCLADLKSELDATRRGHEKFKLWQVYSCNFSL